MQKYAVVRFIPDAEQKWSGLVAAYVDHISSYMARNTLQSSYLPTIRQFDRAVKERVGPDPELSRIDARVIDSWVSKVRIRYRGNSSRTKIVVVRSLFNYAVSEGFLHKSPVGKVRLPPQSFAGRILSDEEIKHLLFVMRPDVRAVCIVALYTGMRLGELEAMEWDWIMADMIAIPAMRAKSRRSRAIKFGSAVREAMGPAKSAGRVFAVGRGTIHKAMTTACKQAGIGRVRFHDFRHTWAGRHYDENEDMPALLDDGGWANIASVMPYQKMTETRKRKILGIKYAIG